MHRGSLSHFSSSPQRSCLDHLRVRSEMNLGGPLPNVSHPCQQPKCTIYHDATGSAPAGPSDRTMGLHGQARMEQGKAPSGSSCNPGGSWEGNHRKHQRQPAPESFPLAKWRGLPSGAESEPRHDGRIMNRPHRGHDCSRNETQTYLELGDIF